MSDATTPDNVDDMLIYGRIISIDGEGGTLGAAGPLLLRLPSAPPIASIVELDADDLDEMSDE